MKDPAPWLDDPAVPKAASALLARARRVPSPSAAAKARMGARIAASTGASAHAVGLGGWWIAGGTIGLAVVLLGIVLARSHSHATASRLQVVPPVVSVASIPPEAPAPVAAAEPVAPSAEAVQSPAPVPVNPRAAASASAHVGSPSRIDGGATPAVEQELLRRAHAALQDNPAGALDLVREHTARFPHGQLVEEREYIAVRALARLDRNAEARVRAQAFLRRFPNGLYSEPVRRVVENLR
jgi:hypothetical protein